MFFKAGIDASNPVLELVSGLILLNLVPALLGLKLVFYLVQLLVVEN